MYTQLEAVSLPHEESVNGTLYNTLLNWLILLTCCLIESFISQDCNSKILFVLLHSFCFSINGHHSSFTPVKQIYKQCKAIRESERESFPDAARVLCFLFRSIKEVSS